MKARVVASMFAWVSATVVAAPLKALLIERQDDPRFERTRLERAYLGQPGGPAADGVGLALEESRFQLEAGGRTVSLARAAVASVAAAKAGAVDAQRQGAAVLLTDLPAEWTRAVAEAVPLPVINVGASDDVLRGAACGPRLFHTLPSERMRADAVAQVLVERRWSQVLLLVGPGEANAARAAAAQGAIRRFGLKLTGTRPYKVSADPRERDLANPALLTGGVGYDAVWVVDVDGEFARGLPYRTVLPRPVVGDGGLVALAWQAGFERYGAPQVSRRFQRAARRSMTDHDWAAWMGGKALVALAAAPDASAKALGAVSLDGSKGVGLTFRPWDGQLRQPMLLTDGQGVAAQAPVAGILHPTEVLDTLGAEAREAACRARS